MSQKTERIDTQAPRLHALRRNTPTAELLTKAAAVLLPAIVALLAMVLLTSASQAATEVADREALRTTLGLTSYDVTRSSDVQIAVLDNGFDGFSPGRGLLPESAEMPTLTQIGPAPSSHGLGMAQIIWAIAGKNASGPKFHLLNSNGFTNLKAAIDRVISKKVDIVLYSQVWPFGGNFDGSGFINEQVNRATREGVLWINAAGNNAGLVHNGEIVSRWNRGDNLLYYSGRDSLRFENQLDENSVTITLSWNDFRETDSYNTSKDLDLQLLDSAGNIVGSSELIQRGEAPPQGDASSRLSSHAREALTARLDRGEYRIRVRVKSTNFVATDRFRILLKPEKAGAVDFLDRTQGSEIMPPADNPNVLTVAELGDLSATGPTLDGRVKPDLWLEDARVTFTNGAQARGSSTAAALFAGVIALMKTEQPRLTRELLATYARGLGSGVTPVDCAPANLSELDMWTRAMIPAGARIMRHRVNNYYVVFTDQDPLEVPAIRAAGAYRAQPDDVIVAYPARREWYVFPRGEESSIHWPLVAFKKWESVGGLSVWRTPTPETVRGWTP